MIPLTVTFYSYKGGVGRSLLAANIGVLCARRGKTLLWDLDIEAPGLHNIARLTPARPIKSGFFEWLDAWQESDKPASAADFAEFVKLACPTPVSDKLFVLPAYGDGKDFAALYQGIRWERFLVEDLDSGLALFRGALTALGEAGFETVLLDSRTGITDIGGLLAALLPHATVLVGNYGRQNTKGLAHVWQALAPASEGREATRGDLPPLSRLLVASPIAIDDADLYASGQAVWKEAFGLAPKEVVTIPYEQRLLFSEDLYAETRPDSPVAKAYADLERRIEEVRQRVLAETEAALRSQSARPDLVAQRKDRHAQGKSFEERVAHLLRLLGYAVEHEQLIDANRVDLVARKRADFGREEVYLVECKDHQAAIAKETVQIFRTWLDGQTARQMGARGMIVAANDFSPAARAYSREQGMHALSYDELERSLFDFSPYLARIRQRYEAGPLPRTYVDQFLQLERQSDKKPVPMLPHALAWIKGSGSRLWLVLGDYGTGKSTLVERLAYELACKCAEDPDSPIPIAINLRQFPNAISLESLIREHLESELRAVLNPEIVLHLLEAGRVVLLLDSFDEMGVAQAGRSVEDQFRQLVRPTAAPGTNPRGNRVLITSRSHFFRDSKSARQAVQGNDELFESDSPLGKAARAFDATLDTLPVFSQKQIREYLSKRLGAIEGDRAWQRIEKTYGLREIASTPQLLDMVVASLPDLLAQGERVTTASLYLTYTSRWLNTVRLSQAEVGVDHLRELLERMACELWKRPRNQIHYADLAALLREEQGLSRGLDSERVDLELRTAAFLVRSADGYYRFSHRSFLEFFFARALFRSLKEGNFAEKLASGRINPETTTFLVELAEAANPSVLTTAIRQILEKPYAAGVSENALLIARRAASLRADPAEDFDRFSAAQRELIPANAQLAGARLAGADLKFLCAEGIDFAGAELSGAVLSEARLKGARFDRAILEDARLDGALLEAASLIGTNALRIAAKSIKLDGADCREASFDGADLRQMCAHGTDFSGASLRLARLADAHFDAAKLSECRLAGATWPRASGFGDTAGASPLAPMIAGLIGHTNSLEGIKASAFSADSSRIVTAGEYGLRLWDFASGKEIRRFAGHAGSVNACAISTNGDRVLTAGEDGSACLWDCVSGELLRRFTLSGLPLDSCALSPDRTRVLITDTGGNARLFGAAGNREARDLRGNLCCAFSSDGGKVLIGSDTGAVMWDSASGSELHRFGESKVSGCAFSADGTLVLTAESEGTVRTWDAVSGEELRRSEGLGDLSKGCAFSGDGSRFLTTARFGDARLFDATSGEELRRFEHLFLGAWCALSADGRHVLTTGPSGATLWDAASGEELRYLAGSVGSVTACAISGDGTHLLTVASSSSAHLWDAATGKKLRRFHESPFSTDCAFSPDGRSVLFSNFPGDSGLYEIDSGRLHRLGNTNIGDATCAFSPDGCLALIGGYSGTALWNTATCQQIGRFEVDKGIVDCAFSPDGTSALTVGPDGARLWTVGSLKEAQHFAERCGKLTACAFSPDGQRILTAGLDGFARLWDATSLEETLRFTGHRGTINSCAYSPDGNRVLTAGDDGSVRVWNAASGEEISEFAGHGGAVNDCVFSADGSRIFTAGIDGTARLWDSESGEELLAVAADGDSWVCWRSSKQRWDGEGRLTEQLRYEDRAEKTDGSPGWVPRHWLAADLPELRGITPLPAAGTVTQRLPQDGHPD